MTAALRDIGELLAWAASPRETPARNDEYDRLVRRYVDDPDFADAVDAVFVGAGLRVTFDRRDGAIVIADPTSPLRFTTADITKRITDPHRSVLGIVMLGIARACYPDAAMIEDPDHIAVFTTQTVVDLLDRAAQAHADEADEDGDLDPNLVEVWRRWLALGETRPNAMRRSATRDRGGAVRKVCIFLVERGHLTNRGELDGGTWSSRPRFRHAVAALTDDPDLYRIVNDLTEDRTDDLDR